jgi:hypothetical protein
MDYATIPSGKALTSRFRYSHSVVATLGYSRNITYCLTAPPYILCCIVIILNGLHSDKVQERFLHVLCPLAMTIVANVIAVATTKTAPRYFAMMLMPASCECPPRMPSHQTVSEPPLSRDDPSQITLREFD